MSRALVVFSTRKGVTADIATCVAEGLSAAGVEVEVVDAEAIGSAAALDGFEAYIFGSATYHGEMMQSAKKILFLADQLNLKGRIGGSFGAFGWSGEASIRLFETMRHIMGMEMVAAGPLRVRSAALAEECGQAQTYGAEVAARLANKG